MHNYDSPRLKQGKKTKIVKNRKKAKVQHLWINKRSKSQRKWNLTSDGFLSKAKFQSLFMTFETVYSW